MSIIPEIHFEEVSGYEGDIGLITLTRQSALNALNHRMFIALNEQLAVWESAAHIKAVVIRAAEGRAFCAGGDIRHAYELKMKNDASIATFFCDEYQMNKRIHHFSKPYIALLDGITMGGGVGISWHGSHRVATEKLIFSMPETGIGFYPDVGTTYYLSRCQHYLGFYLGLTGARIDAQDSIAVGFAQYLIAHDDLQKLLDTFIHSPLPDKLAVTTIIKNFSLPAGSSTLLAHQHEIETCFAKNTIETILHELEKNPSPWCQQTAAIIKTKSPTSLKITLYALQKAATLSFDECMQMEYRLTNRFVQGHDFFEGIRAAIIDKDQSPQWNPKELGDVKSSQVESYFAPLEKELI